MGMDLEDAHEELKRIEKAISEAEEYGEEIDDSYGLRERGMSRIVTQRVSSTFDVFFLFFRTDSHCPIGK
jgi:hypothetical protein